MIARRAKRQRRKKGRKGERKMNYPELARYADELFGDRLERITADAEVSRATAYNMKNGKRARPDSYERIALAVGRTRIEQREIYKTLMKLSGYLDLIDDQSDEAIEQGQDELVLAEIRRRLPELYAAAEALLAARRRGGQDDTKGEDHPVQDKAK